MEDEDATSATSADVMGHGVASCVNDSVCSMCWRLWNRYWHASIQDPWHIVFCSIRLASIRELQGRFSGRLSSTPAQSDSDILKASHSKIALLGKVPNAVVQCIVGLVKVLVGVSTMRYMDDLLCDIRS